MYVINTVGSICSGIEAASVAWCNLGFKFEWFSEIADFPSRLLQERYPNIPNIGDMNNIPDKLLDGKIEAPDLICGGTPCQAFSLAGWKNGLNDSRGNLTLKFVDIINANDSIRKKQGKKSCLVFWENVEGVLTDKTNAFGCLVSSLAGLDSIIDLKKWPKAGLINGPKRNVAWRVLDAKFFGIPQQRRRLYLIAGGIDFHPENVLFEYHTHEFKEFPRYSLTFQKDGNNFEIFREYTDCLYSAYGTKWNGNAAAYNGSLYVVQNQRLRRLSVIECERLMGFPDNYTNINNAKKTCRYQAIGNSWVVPVVKWIGKRIVNYNKYNLCITADNMKLNTKKVSDTSFFFNLDNDFVSLDCKKILNCSAIPEHYSFGNMQDIVCSEATDDIYISPVGCHGIYRRRKERGLSINPKLEQILISTFSKMPIHEIEKRSLVQKRGEHFQNQNKQTQYTQYCLFAS